MLRGLGQLDLTIGISYVVLLTVVGALKCRARIERERGAYDASIATLRIAIFEAEGLEDRLLQAEMLREFGQTSRALGNPDEARLAWREHGAGRHLRAAFGVHVDRVLLGIGGAGKDDIGAVGTAIAMAALIDDEGLAEPAHIDFVGAEQIDDIDLALFGTGENRLDVPALLTRHEAEVEAGDSRRGGMQDAEPIPTEIRLHRAHCHRSLGGEREHSGEAYEPFVSVIVPAYNEEFVIEATIRSLLNSDYDNLEIIVVDDGSTDGSRQWLLEQAAARGEEFRVISFAENRGFAPAANAGAAESSGEFLCLLNNDTVATRGWLSALLRHLERDPSLGMIGPSTNEIANEARVEVGYRDPADLEAWARAFTRARRPRRWHRPGWQRNDRQYRRRERGRAAAGGDRLQLRWLPCDEFFAQASRRGDLLCEHERRLRYPPVS